MGNIKYLVLPRLSFRGATAQPAWWCVGSPGPLAARGFCNALALAMGGEDLARKVHGVGLVSHDFSLRAESIKGRTLPHQFRAASFVNNQDYAGGGSTLSAQPTVRCDGIVSLVLALDSAVGIDGQAIDGFLRRARFAGGSVASYSFRPSTPLIADSLDDAARLARSGFAFHDRADLLEPKNGERDPLDAFLRATHRKLVDNRPAKADDPWLMPYLAGMRAATAVARRPMSRDGLPHAFAEPLVGLGQLVSIRTKGIPIWDYSTGERGLYCVTQIH